MNSETLRLAYLPLIDAAPLIVAQEIGFSAEEGLHFDLVRLQSWAQSRDLLGTGGIDAAHMLVPMPIAQTLGLGPDYPRFDLVMFLSQGGQAIAISAALETALRGIGHGFAFDDPARARDTLARVADRPLRVGVPFPFSTQAELVRRWVRGSALEARVSIHTVPPPMMASALAAGEVDAFCVGEPWASHAVETASGSLLLAGRSIWGAPPEKGLVLTRDFAETRPELTGRMMRAVWRACRWLDQADNRGTAAEILSRPEYLNLPPELSERGLMGRLHISAQGEIRHYPDFIRFHDGGANFPWRSLAALFAAAIAKNHGLDPAQAMARATGCFRTDLYRQHLRGAGADLPGASARIEGAMAHPTAVASEKGQMILGPDAFFDGLTFDPAFMAG
jgi:NitT/TauT family transport system ATP-binding protein